MKYFRWDLRWGLILTTGILLLFTLYPLYRSPLLRDLRRGERINILILGTDWVDYAQHADTIILFSYDPRKCFLDLLAIPRDTYFSVSGTRVKRINEVYAHAYRTQRSHLAAAGELRTSVNQLLSNPALPVSLPYHIQVDYAGFKNIVDLCGGVSVEVTKPMHYEDKRGNLQIHFQPGTYRLDGDSALKYIRFRASGGDRGRIFRQQIFLRQLLRQIKEPINLFRAPLFYRELRQHLHTNLTLWELANLLLELARLPSGNIRLSQLPGKNKGVYWQTDREATEQVMRIIFGKAAQREGNRVITVEVWNASSHPGIAYQVTRRLRQRGFDVLLYGNFATRQQRTLVIDHSGDLTAAQAIATIIAAPELITRFDPERLVDVAVILGEDFPELKKY